MAPQRTTKRSSYASNSRQRIDEHSEDFSRSDSTANSMDIDDRHRDEESQETQSRSAQELLSNMVAGARKRHMVNKKNVLESYAKTTNNIEEDINSVFDEHEETASTAHEAQLKRLKDLLSHKAKLEAAMEAKLQILRTSYAAHSQDVEKVLNQRIKELK